MIYVYSSERNALANSAKKKTTTNKQVIKLKKTQNLHKRKTTAKQWMVRGKAKHSRMCPEDAVCEWKCTLYANVVAILHFFLPLFMFWWPYFSSVCMSPHEPTLLGNSRPLAMKTVKVYSWWWCCTSVDIPCRRTKRTNMGQNNADDKRSQVQKNKKMLKWKFGRTRMKPSFALLISTWEKIHDNFDSS